jgi:hypothetical protein
MGNDAIPGAMIALVSTRQRANHPIAYRPRYTREPKIHDEIEDIEKRKEERQPDFSMCLPHPGCEDAGAN